eukprot:g3161.t1 g3161   contig12:1539913-1540281(+)
MMHSYGSHHNITHCQSGYRRYFVALKDFLKSEFGDLIAIQEKMDRGITGNFEVIIVNTNTLIHSKRAGQGKAESARERQFIVEQIRQALEDV